MRHVFKQLAQTATTLELKSNHLLALKRQKNAQAKSRAQKPLDIQLTRQRQLYATQFKGIGKLLSARQVNTYISNKF